ncbi:MAG: hypothetical protein ACOVQJ_08870 [Bacteroidia bacterium]
MRISRAFILISTSVFIILLIAFSCKRDIYNISTVDGNVNTHLTGTPVSIPSGTISLQYGMLHFSSRETFLDIMDTLNTKTYAQSLTWKAQFPGFQSLLSVYDASPLEETTESPCDDDDLNTLLNSNSMIWIDNSAFLLDWAKDSIYEVYPVNLATIDSVKLKKEILDNDSLYVMRYSMEDEILYPDSSVQYVGVFKWLKKVFGKCTDKHASPKIDETGSPYYYSNNQSGSNKIDYKYKYKLKYQRAGIYFSLIYKVKHYESTESQSAWRASPGKTCMDLDYEYKKYCSGSDSYSNTCPTSHSSYGWNLVDHKWKRRIYGGSVRLAKFTVDITPYFEDVSNTATLTGQDLSIEDNWP